MPNSGTKLFIISEDHVLESHTTLDMPLVYWGAKGECTHPQKDKGRDQEIDWSCTRPDCDTHSHNSWIEGFAKQRDPIAWFAKCPS